jgi:RNA polymerase sigma factor (sigma-70 family)
METALTLKIGKVFDREHSRLLGFIRKRVNNPEDAEDILQDVFYSTIQGASVTEPVENMLGWIYTVARNKIIDWYRKKRHTNTSIENDLSEGSLEHLLSDSELHPEKIFLRKLILEEIEACIEELPDKQKEVVIMQMIEGKTFREISEITGEPINTLLSRKRYAIAALQKRLKEINKIVDECE